MKEGTNQMADDPLLLTSGGGPHPADEPLVDQQSHRRGNFPVPVFRPSARKVLISAVMLNRYLETGVPVKGPAVEVLPRSSSPVVPASS